jgi:2-polyprenyl-3-methyl-5-hydroxy-6-metoxy-1,4-benzoquinol methylase
VVSWLLNKLRNKGFHLYIKFHYIYYILMQPALRAKIADILRLDETDVGLANGEEPEQSLPGLDRYYKTNYYQYMLGRYLYSIKYIAGKSVLDCGCGFGWGSYLISDYPGTILSIDLNKAALDFANATWKDEKLNFKRHSVLDLESLNQQFDVILAYELIEHLRFDDGELFIKKTGKVLNKKGVLILSSWFPLSQKRGQKSELQNEYHLHIYARKEIGDLLNKAGYSKVRFLGHVMVLAKK